MLKIIREKGIMLLLFLLFYFIFEAITFSYVGLPIVPSYAILDFIILIFICSIIFLIKSNIIALVYLGLLMLGIDVLFIANVTLNKVFGDMFSLQYLTLLSEAGEVFEWSFLDVGAIIAGILLFTAYIYLNIKYVRHEKKEYVSDRCYALNGMFIIIPVLIALSLVFDLNIGRAKKTAIVNNKIIEENIYIKYLTKKALSHYGMITLYYKEISLLNEDFDSKKEVVVVNELDDIKTEYNGLLKGKNVITIMAESLQDYVISEALTPNLWKLRTQGLNFTNNYSVNKTNMSEIMGVAGSYYSLLDNTYDIPFAIPNIINDEYKTSYFHDNNAAFYSRGTINKYLGFENNYFHDDIYPSNFTNDIYPDGLHWENNSWNWVGDYTLDSLTMERILPNLVSTSEPFYSFWTSLSTHGPYDQSYRDNSKLFEKFGYFSRINEAKRNDKWTNPLENRVNYKEYLEYYQACVMDLDCAIGELLTYLESKNLLDDTLIVIYGDHEVYYHDIYLQIANTDNTAVVDKLYQTTMIMYNPTLTSKYLEKNVSNEVNTFASPFIVAPTILDLIGANYNPSDYVNYAFYSSKYIPVFYSYQQRAYMDNIVYTEDCETERYTAKYLTDDELVVFYYNCNLLFERLAHVDELFKNCIVD